MVQKILFPVDFSASCIAMAAYVERAAAIFCANVTIAHVCDLASHNGFELYARRSDEIAEDHWNLAKNRLALFLESSFAPATCRRLLLTGDAASAITSCQEGQIRPHHDANACGTLSADAPRFDNGEGAQRGRLPSVDDAACGDGAAAAHRASKVGLRPRVEPGF
jgi:hypothetical protein